MRRRESHKFHTTPGYAATWLTEIVDPRCGLDTAGYPLADDGFGSGFDAILIISEGSD
jgi:hypothetical protein